MAKLVSSCSSWLRNISRGVEKHTNRCFGTSKPWNPASKPASWKNCVSSNARVCNNLLPTSNAAPFQSLHSSHVLRSAVPKPNPETNGVTSVQRSQEKNNLEVTYANGETCSYPYVWLRDVCRCPQCYSKESNDRIYPMIHTDVDIKPKSLDNTSGDLKVTWPDGHESLYESDWLWKHRFTDSAIKEREKLYRHNTKHWGADLKIPTFDFNETITRDEILYQYIRNLDEYGIVLLKNTPCEVGQVQRIGKRVNFLKKTNYGETFTVMTKEDPSHAAYTTARLPMHTDTTYCFYRAGVQILHCIAQCEEEEGGVNEFSDAFNVADIMEKSYPEEYKLLCNTSVNYQCVGFDGTKYNKRTRHPVFTFNEDGALMAATFNDVNRDTELTVPLDTVEPLYRAFKVFVSLLYDTKNLLKYKMEQGDMVSFNNLRVLHGRTAIDPTQFRHLEGGYLDWDELHSRMRVLQIDLGIKD